jgi:hypothetical protein
VPRGSRLSGLAGGGQAELFPQKPEPQLGLLPSKLELLSPKLHLHALDAVVQHDSH